MSVTTIEGVVKNGQIVLPENSNLPEAARVYIVVHDNEKPKRIFSPRLANKSDAQYLVKTVEDDIEDEI